MRFYRLVILTFLVMMTGGFWGGAPPLAQSRDDAPRLISTRLQVLQALPGLSRRQRIIINSAALANLRLTASSVTTDGSVSQPSQVRLNLFEGGPRPLSFLGIVEAARTWDSTVRLSGRLADDPGGKFEITIAGELVSAEVMSSLGLIEVNPHPDGEHVVEEYSGVGNLPDDTGVTPDGPTTAPSDFAPRLTPGLTARENGSRIDLLFVYTAQARLNVGIDRINLAVTRTVEQLHEAFDESLGPGQPRLRVRVVGTEQVPNGVTTALSQLQNSPSVSQLRRDRRADLVVVITHKDIDAAGYARVYCGNPEVSWGLAHTVINDRHLFYVKTPAHEIGHLLGAEHEPGNAGGCTSAARSMHRGHYFTVGQTQYGTLLSYKGRRINRFSNPDVRYLGAPLGRTTRNNAKAIRESRVPISNYYVATDAPTEPEPGTGPLVALLQPALGTIHPPRSIVVISARVTDSDGVQSVELDYERTGNALPCPGTNNDDWFCEQQGNTYMWVLQIGGQLGERGYSVRAQDSRGNRSDSGRQTFLVGSISANASRIEFLQPQNGGTVPVGDVEIVARVSDPNSVRSAELFWATTRNYLACPGQDSSTWSCTRQGDTFRWMVRVASPGFRAFHVRATDGGGNRTSSPGRTIRVR